MCTSTTHPFVHSFHRRVKKTTRREGVKVWSCVNTIPYKHYKRKKKAGTVAVGRFWITDHLLFIFVVPQSMCVFRWRSPFPDHEIIPLMYSITQTGMDNLHIFIFFPKVGSLYYLNPIFLPSVEMHVNGLLSSTGFDEKICTGSCIVFNVGFVRMIHVLCWPCYAPSKARTGPG